jgi:hypothetical protein
MYVRAEKHFKYRLQGAAEKDPNYISRKLLLESAKWNWICVAYLLILETMPF